MPRTARVVVPDMALHVTQRGHNRGPCFFKDEDFVTYLRMLAYFSRRHTCSVHAYCLMTNHVHLVVGRHGQEMNALDALVLPGISDNRTPTIEKVVLFDLVDWLNNLPWKYFPLFIKLYSGAFSPHSVHFCSSVSTNTCIINRNNTGTILSPCWTPIE